MQSPVSRLSGGASVQAIRDRRDQDPGIVTGDALPAYDVGMLGIVSLPAVGIVNLHCLAKYAAIFWRSVA